MKKAKLSFWQILNMNVGFFGIQYSFGLQQSAVTPIYDFLGAALDQIPLLHLAGPLQVYSCSRSISNEREILSAMLNSNVQKLDELLHQDLLF